jgi:hypothetical protein
MNFVNEPTGKRQMDSSVIDEDSSWLIWCAYIGMASQSNELVTTEKFRRDTAIAIETNYR